MLIEAAAGHMQRTGQAKRSCPCGLTLPTLEHSGANGNSLKFRRGAKALMHVVTTNRRVEHDGAPCSEQGINATD
jgi:hypothetical protein